MTTPADKEVHIALLQYEAVALEERIALLQDEAVVLETTTTPVPLEERDPSNVRDRSSY